MLQSIQNLKGYTVLAPDGPAGQVADIIVDDKTWNVEMLAVDDERFPRQRYLSVWEVRSIDRRTHAIKVAISSGKFTSDPQAIARHGRGVLRSINNLIGCKFVVDGTPEGTVEDLILGDDSWKVDSIAVNSHDPSQPTPKLHNVHRVLDISELDHTLYVDRYEPFFYDTPANVWPENSREEQYEHDRRLDQ